MRIDIGYFRKLLGGNFPTNTATTGQQQHGGRYENKQNMFFNVVLKGFIHTVKTINFFINA